MVALSKLEDNNNKKAAAVAEISKRQQPSKTNSNMDNRNGPTSSAAASTTPAVALTSGGKPKEKRRNNEKRKERSRDAARCRRSKETEIFSELGEVLPLKKEDVQQLDKASIMRIAISYLKVRDMLQLFPKMQELCKDLNITTTTATTSITKDDNDDESQHGSTNSAPNDLDETTQTTVPDEENEEKTSDSTASNDDAETKDDEDSSSTGSTDVLSSPQWLKQTLDGFLLVLSNDGDITYVTDNISDFLGISKIDLLGQQIWEYAHQCDHAELKEALNIKRNGLADKIKDEHLLEEGISTDHRDLFVRLKCTLTSRGRSINIKSASYKVIHITGHLVVNTQGDRVLVAMGRPIPHPSNIEIPLGSTTFLTKHTLDMKFSYVDDRMLDLLGYNPEDLLDTSLFDCHHGVDSESLMATFKNVLSKGQGETCRYRFLGKYGGYCWLLTQATVVYDKLKPQSVVCVNYVISNLEQAHEIYTLQQYEESQKLKSIESQTKTTTKPNNLIEINKNNLIKYQNFSKYQNNNIDNCEKPIKNAIENAVANNDDYDDDDELKLKISNNFENLKLEPQQQKEHLVSKNIDKNNLEILKPKSELQQQTAENNLNKTQCFSTKAAKEIKQEQQQQQQQALATQLASSSISALAPPTTTLHCPTTTVTQQVFVNLNNTNFQNNNSNKPLIIPQQNRPKTVTSSVIRQVATLPSFIANSSLPPTTTSTQSIFKPLNAINQKSQTVTASLFTANAAAQNNKQLQHQLATTSQTTQQLLPSTTTTAAILAQGQREASPSASASTAVRQDMNKGYLTFAEDATELNMLKHEPDDLTAHLVAPNAVDACMPLDETTPFFNEIVGLMDSYSSLLQNDINSLDSTTSTTASSSTSISSPSLEQQNNVNNTNTATFINSNNSNDTSNSSSSNNAHRQTAGVCLNSSSNIAAAAGAGGGTASGIGSPVSAAITNSTNIDPLIYYRDESNDTNCSQHLLSPVMASKSPETNSLPSLCSPNSLSQEDEFTYYAMNVDDMDDLTMRAPYIPMNEQDDLPLLTSDDYMWSSGNAFPADDYSLNTKDATDSLQAIQLSSALSYHHQQQQFTQQQQQFSNSLCSSPASTVSSMSPSPIQQQRQQQQQQQQNSHSLFATDSSELAALLCGTGSGTLSILQDNNNCTTGTTPTTTATTTTNSSNNIVLSAGNSIIGNHNQHHHHQQQQQQHQQLQEHCLQQLNEQLQQHQRQQQQQQQQQLFSGLSGLVCKKEKVSSPSALSSSLCDSIDETYESVYNKNSTNLDCWNDFLQIPTTEHVSCSGNLTGNPTTITTTIAGTLASTEDCNKQIALQQLQQQQQQILSTVPLITIQQQSNISNLSQQQQQQSNIKLAHKVNTIKLLPVTSTATIRIIENKQFQPLATLQQQQQQQQQQQLLLKSFIQDTTETAEAPTITAHVVKQNKRHLNANANESKRLKKQQQHQQNSNSPQLMQQIIINSSNSAKASKDAVTIIKAAAASNHSAMMSQNHSRPWSNENLINCQQQHQQQQQQTNSVLKNLLISGRDEQMKSEIVNIDENSLDRASSMQSPDIRMCMSPTSSVPSPLARPLHCITSPMSALRNYRHNPLIGGPGVMPSPTLSVISTNSSSDDSSPPALTAMLDDGSNMDAASDSGIDDNSLVENMSPLKRSYEPNDEFMACSEMMYDNIPVKNKELKEVGEAPPPPSPPPSCVNFMDKVNKNLLMMKACRMDEEDGCPSIKRKRSISFMDSNNPMNTPLLIELRDDDYRMDTKEFLAESDIENVLTETNWSI